MTSHIVLMIIALAVAITCGPYRAHAKNNEGLHGTEPDRSQKFLAVKEAKLTDLNNHQIVKKAAEGEIKDCYTGLGDNYMGHTSVTKYNQTCQAWTSDEFHDRYSKAKDPAFFPDATLAEASNYCRNPNADESIPWCYIIDKSPRWEYCGIKHCCF